jgi:hypothetical protein
MSGKQMTKAQKYEARLIKNYRRAIDLTISGVTYMGCSVVRGVTVEGIERIRRHTREKYEADALEEIVRSLLRQHPRTFNVWWCVFLADDTELWVHEDTQSFERLKVREFDVVFGQYLQSIIDDLRGKYGYDAVKGYGWVATHGDVNKITARSDMILDQFLDLDILDTEKANRVLTECKLEKQMLGGGNATAEQMEAIRDALAAAEASNNTNSNTNQVEGTV